MNFVLTQALRGLRRDLGTNLLVIAVLSVGIASVMIIFSFVKAMVIDAPPFANAAQVVKIGYEVQDSQESQNMHAPSGADLLEWQRELAPLGKVAGITQANLRRLAHTYPDSLGCPALRNQFSPPAPRSQTVAHQSPSLLQS